MAAIQGAVDASVNQRWLIFECIWICFGKNLISVESLATCLVGIRKELDGLRLEDQTDDVRMGVKDKWNTVIVGGGGHVDNCFRVIVRVATKAGEWEVRVVGIVEVV